MTVARAAAIPATRQKTGSLRREQHQPDYVILVAVFALVVMVTVAEDAEGVARAVASGARGYVVKDASREEMAATVVLLMSPWILFGSGILFLNSG